MAVDLTGQATADRLDSYAITDAQSAAVHKKHALL